MALGEFGKARAEFAEIVLGFGSLAFQAANRFSFPLATQMLDAIGVVAGGIVAEGLGDDREMVEEVGVLAVGHKMGGHDDLVLH